MVEDSKHLSHRTWRNQVAIDLAASFLLVSFHSAGRCHAFY